MPRRVAAHLALAALAIGLLMQASRFSGGMPDEAFLTFRFAAHLAAAEGPAFTPPARVEAFASPVWVLMLAAGQRSGLDLELWARLLGLACALASLALVHQVALGLCDRSMAWLVAGTWLAACTPFALWAVGGLETPLQALLLLAIPLALHRGWPAAAALASLGLAAARPEGTLLAWLTIAHGLWLRHRDGRTPAWLPRYAAGSIALISTFHAARFMLCGTLIPRHVMTLPAGGTAQLASAASYGYGALVGYLPVPVLVLAAAALSFRSSEGPLFTLPPVLILGQLAGLALVGGDWLPLYRLLVPFAPLVFLLAAAGLETVLGLIGPFLSRLDRGVAVAGITLCALKLHAVPVDQTALLRQQEALARLEDHAGAHLKGRKGRLACTAVGRLGYRSGLPVLDAAGRLSPEAGVRGPCWVLDRGAEWIALPVEGRDRLARGLRAHDRELLSDPRLDSEYRLDARFPDPELPLEYRVYRRLSASGDSRPGTPAPC